MAIKIQDPLAGKTLRNAAKIPKECNCLPSILRMSMPTQPQWAGIPRTCGILNEKNDITETTIQAR